MWKIIVQDGKVLLQKIVDGVETGEQIAVKYLEKEAHQAVDFFKTEFATPQVKTDVADAIAAGEQALAALATGAEGVIGPAEQAAIADAETLVGNYIEAKGGAETVAKLVETGIGSAGAVLVSVTQAAFAKVVSALTTAAAAQGAGSAAAAS